MKGTHAAIALLSVIISLGAASCSRQASLQPGKQTTCPVMKGNKIDPKMYVDVDGKRIYVCCPGCLATIKADPEKYLHEMEAAGVVLAASPTTNKEQ